MLKALVVDDEKTTRDVLVNFIPWASIGINTVVDADNGLNALKIASEFQPDIVLSDIKMPKMNGIELAEILQKQQPECRFVFLSGYSDKEYLKSAIRLKAVSYVEKPIDIDEITKALKAASAESSQAKASMQIQQRIMKEKLCLRLAAKQNAAEDNITTIQFPEFELPEDSTYLSSFIWLQPQEHDTERNLTQFRDEVECIIQETLMNIQKRCLIGFKGDQYVIIHFKTSSIYNKEYIVKLMQTLQANMKTSCTNVKNVLIGIGSEVTGRENIHASFEKAVIAQKRCFFTGNTHVYTAGNSSSYSIKENKLIEFSEYIKTKNKSMAVLFINRLKHEIQEHMNTDSDSIKKFFSDIFLILLRFTEDRNLSALKYSRTIYLDNINNAATLEEITSCIILILERIFSEIENTGSDENIAARITAYIQNHFQDEHLSISSIAEKMYLTPNYLSLLYKKETGKTINQYITDIRISNAKQYLKRGSIKLNQVAKSVGYSDAKYFTKVFEKNTGLKPKEYRERHTDESDV